MASNSSISALLTDVILAMKGVTVGERTLFDIVEVDVAGNRLRFVAVDPSQKLAIVGGGAAALGFNVGQTPGSEDLITAIQDGLDNAGLGSDIIADLDGTGKISLWITRSMAFSGVTIQDISNLSRLGFSNGQGLTAFIKDPVSSGDVGDGNQFTLSLDGVVQALNASGTLDVDFQIPDLLNLRNTEVSIEGSSLSLFKNMTAWC